MDVVNSALSVVLDDAEKIADNLVPPGSSVEKVLGVLIKQVESAVGGKIAALTDKELGIATAEQEKEAAATTAAAEKPAPTAPIPPAVPTGGAAPAVATTDAASADALASAGVVDAAQTKAERIAAIKAQYDKEIAEAEAS